ncbi:MAG: universal stress protein [Pseudomonadota bacterium]
MSVKSILCAYSGDPTKGSGLRHAIRVAQHYDAHLTGVAKNGGIPFLHRQFAAQLPRAVQDQLEENGRVVTEAVEARFHEITAQAGMSDRAEFLELDADRDGPIAALARAFDLVVIGHHGSAPYEDEFAAHPDLIALRSGRPVLVVPDGYDTDVLASDVLVAWDGKRAATRALTAAMPVLAEKAKITLLSVGTTPKNTDRLARTIERHGVPVDAITVTARGTIANTILAEADERAAKLIVMGAFEHSKFSHDIIGGATTDVLERAAVPILMAH